jgi:UDP-glucose 4-epimerase
VNILVTGSAGFLMGYVVRELLSAGHEVTGVDNLSKYGPVRRGYDNDPSYRFIEADAKDATLLGELMDGCHQVVAAAARVGGVRYINAYPYDILAENERIASATFDASIRAFTGGSLQKINLISSSAVYERTSSFPTAEGYEVASPPPSSSYGLQKLSSEYFARAAWKQYGLPYTIIRPFNCIGTGEVDLLRKAEVFQGNISQLASHVVPELVGKILRGDKPLHIIGSGLQTRHYTYAGDVARGIRLCMENSEATNQDFNLASREATTVLELATRIWLKVHGADDILSIVHDPPPGDDVDMRWPDTSKARRILGFEATTSLDDVLDDIITLMRAWRFEGSSSSTRGAATPRGPK